MLKIIFANKDVFPCKVNMCMQFNITSPVQHYKIKISENSYFSLNKCEIYMYIYYNNQIKYGHTMGQQFQVNVKKHMSNISIVKTKQAHLKSKSMGRIFQSEQLQGGELMTLQIQCGTVLCRQPNTHLLYQHYHQPYILYIYQNS